MPGARCIGGRRPGPGQAYGLDWAGVQDSTDLRPAGAAAQVDVAWGAVDDRAAPSPAIGPTQAFLRLSGASCLVHRDPLRVVIGGQAHSRPGELVHPHLATLAAVISPWLGREAFQGGVVVGRVGALAVLGGTGAGKSTLLASLATAGHPVLSDELVVVEAGSALAGAATMVVRNDAAERLGLDVGLAPAWGGHGTRIPLPTTVERAPLAGWVVLGDADEDATLRPLPIAERVAALGRARLHGDLHPDGGALLDLAALPAWTLRRARSPAGHRAATAITARLLDGPMS